MQSKWLEVAQGQGGAIRAAQLAASGVSRGQIRGLLRDGILRSGGRGIYLLPDASRNWGSELRVELVRAGPKAFLCGRSAAAVWEFDGVEPGHLDLAVHTRRNPGRAGTHRLLVVRGDVVRHQDLPLTSPARTLLDLGGFVKLDVLERSLEFALRNRMVTLESLADRSSCRSSVGTRRLAAILAARPAGAAPTESDAETLFLQLVRSMGLPDPARQVHLTLQGRRYRLDFAWPELRLAVEVDSTAVHGPDQLDRDLLRQNQVILDGWMILRFSWNLVVRSCWMVERDLREAWALRTIVSSLG